jgi:hypothetical protein
VPNFQSAQPARFIAGMTQDLDFQPLASMGAPDPFFYALYEDDFLPWNPNLYLASGTGEVAAALAGPGGLIQLTAAATINDSTSLQLGAAPVGQFAIQSTSRLFYGARISLSAVPGPGFIAGLCNVTTTPFTAVSDGLFFQMAGASSTISFNSYVGGTQTGTVSLASIFTPTANTYFDLAFYYTPYSSLGGNVMIYAGSNLWGDKSVGQNSANLGPIARLIPTSFTTANLTPTLGVNTTTATAYTMNADFQMAALQR